MKNLKNLGEVLTREQQKSIRGGGYCSVLYSQGTWGMDCLDYPGLGNECDYWMCAQTGEGTCIPLGCF